MAGPIAVELVASPSNPPEADVTRYARALVDSCSRAAGPAGCVLELDALDAPQARARVVVTFSEAYGRVRVEVLAPPFGVAPPSGVAAPSREVVFRSEDPCVERFRAAGLIVAGLVSALESPDAPALPELEASTRAPPPLESAPATPRHEALVRLGGEAGWNDERPWAGAELGADFLVVGPAFVALSGSYQQTWARDASGIADQRTALGLGAGLAAPLVPERLELRVRIELEVDELRASIHQPATGREDAGSRTLGGLEAGADLLLPTDAAVGAFAGARLAWWGDDTTVRVEGRPAETLRAWALSFALGLNVRLP
jgi:hypothetical protein